MDDKVIHHVFANKSNIGDWLAARGIQSLLKPLEIQEHFCDEPFVDETIARLVRVRPDDFVIIGGGGLFMDYFLPFWERFLAIADGVQFGIWGVGYCDLKREVSRPSDQLLSAVIGKSRFTYVRDELTRKHLADCNLPPSIGCPSLFDIPQAAWPGNGILHVDNYTTAGEDVFEAMNDYARRVAAERGCPLRRTNNRLEGTKGSEQAAIAQLSRILDSYQQSEVVLSSALHGCIIGLAMNKKVVAVSGDYKIESFMEAVGLSDWVCDITDVQRVPELLTDASQQPSPRVGLEAMKLANRNVADIVRSTCCSPLLESSDGSYFGTQRPAER